MQPGQATILKHAYTFGISEWEMFWPLAVGGTLVIPKPGGEKDPEYIFGLCEKYPAACGKSRHRASPALWVAIVRVMIVMMTRGGGGR